MKKIMTATLLAAAVLPITSVHAEGSTHPQKMQSVRHATIQLPDLSNQATVNKIKNGTYRYKGIGLGDNYDSSTKKLGQYQSEKLESMDLGTVAQKAYSNEDIIIVGLNKKRTLSTKAMTVDSIDFKYHHTVNYNDIKSLLGKAKTTEVTKNGTKNTKDDEMIKEYDKSVMTFHRSNGQWQLDELYITDDTTMTEDKHAGQGLYKNQPIKTLTKDELKAMKQGTYQFHDIALHSSYQDVLKKIGQSNEDIIERKNNKQQFSSIYGQTEPLGFFYKKAPVNSDVKKAELEKIRFAYNEKNIKVSTFEKTVGQPTSSVVKSTNEYGDKVQTLYKSYGKHLSIIAEKTKGQWYVIDVSYK